MFLIPPCDLCKQEIPESTRYWSIQLTLESHKDGEIVNYDVEYLRTFCDACSKQYDLDGTQIPKRLQKLGFPMNQEYPTKAHIWRIRNWKYRCDEDIRCHDTPDYGLEESDYEFDNSATHKKGDPVTATCDGCEKNR